MQLNENTILPYPCLNLNFGGERETKIDFEIKTSNMVHTTFRVWTKVNNKDIERLINTGYAKYCLELDCQKAMFREAYLNEDGDFTITLPKHRFNGRVNGSLSIVAVEEIRQYRNNEFDDFYKSFDINIGPGEALAFLGNIEIMMQERSQDVKNIADDFIEVVYDETLKYSRFDLGGPKILLKLPVELFEQYNNSHISQNRDCEAYLHASFLLNVLTSALQNISQYRNNRWAEALRDRIMQEDELREIAAPEDGMEPFDVDGALANPDVTLDLAQAILGNPYERMFTSLGNLNNLNDED